MADGQSNQDIDLFGLARSRITRSFIEYEFGAPGAYWSGPKFMTLNPTRDDKTIKSFSIREDGKWYEFADGSNGDVFDLIAARDGIEPVQAVKAFLGEDAQPYTAAPKHKSKKAKPSCRASASWSPSRRMPATPATRRPAKPSTSQPTRPSSSKSARA